jgi:hypothetical protein
MKVYIGKYPQFFGTMQVAQLLRFWDKKRPITDKFSRDSEATHELYSKLTFKNKDWKQQTRLARFLSWVNDQRKQTIRVRIDPWDTWSLDTTLAHIIVPCLKQLKGTQHGAGDVDDADVPAALRSTAAPPTKSGVDDNHFKRWDYVLDQMIWSFERLLENDEPEGEEYKRMRRGFQLFGKYYTNLWD